MHNDEAMKALLQNRRFLYELLFRVFATEPDEALLAVLRDDHVVGECAYLDDTAGEETGAGGVAAAGGDAAVGGAAAVAGAACGTALVEAARAVTVDDLRSEYTRQFIGPASLPAPPWESVFRAQKPVLFQESTLAVRAAYRAAGFKAAGYPHEADDHLATELSFMAALAEQTLAAVGATDDALAADGAAIAADAAAETSAERFAVLVDAQRRFLDEHLLVWIGEYASRLTDAARPRSVYAAAASVAALVCRRDSDLLAELAALD